MPKRQRRLKDAVIVAKLIAWLLIIARELQDMI